MELFTFGQDGVQVSAPFGSDVSQSLTMNGDLTFNFPMDSLESQCMSACSMPATVSSVMSSMPTAGFLSSSVTSDDTPAFATANYFGSVPATISPALLSNLSPRMSQLIDYYDKAICPILVAVDGPKNPYRVHILALAQACGPTLTNAIAALAANVLHQRTTAAVNPGYSMSPLSQPRGANEEALQFKATAVSLFNAAAHDPSAAHDDSLLATLVVLALFGISENGVAKLKSQLPEVRQIMAMRGANSSQFLYWANMFFTWLDVMTATVADKETQIRNPCLDLLDFSANLGSLEHLAFSEGRMYKVVARMSSAAPHTRLAHSHSHSHSSTFSAQPRPATDARRHSINPFTGLPMASPPPPKATTIAATNGDMAATAPLDGVMSGSSADARQEFWSEWSGVRARLRRWTRDGAGPSGSSTPGAFLP
jgi:hypothetical protein